MMLETLTQAPSRSLDQRMEALTRATRFVLPAHNLKRDLKERRIRIEQVIADPPDYVLTAKVYDMLVAVPRLGGSKLAAC